MGVAEILAVVAGACEVAVGTLAVVEGAEEGVLVVVVKATQEAAVVETALQVVVRLTVVMSIVVGLMVAGLLLVGLTVVVTGVVAKVAVVVTWAVVMEMSRATLTTVAAAGTVSHC